MTVTRQQVIDMVGQTDDECLVEILETGATSAELAEAWRWIGGDRRTLGDNQPLRPAIVEELFDILSTEDPEWDEV
ncbi:hypothetical protein [Telmatospirillum sp.]|uniref:hypothetical protein n=1 Tax=Telmatospirillum sp. TaxID=2079197 RepID=UPI00284277BC|nr:hypothetical protein [Telmatospirillum sp.]MDR3435404.1 hypothetical protein [Telmatospirillum sp.]